MATQAIHGIKDDRTLQGSRQGRRLAGERSMGDAVFRKGRWAPEIVPATTLDSRSPLPC